MRLLREWFVFTMKKFNGLMTIAKFFRTIFKKALLP